MRTKSSILTFCLLIFLSLAFFSCTRDYSNNIPKIVLWHEEDAQVIPFVKERIAAFEALYPGKVKVEEVHYDPENIHQQYLTAAIAGAGPELVMAPGDKAGIFSVGAFIQPLENLIDPKDYMPVALDAVRENGHIWGVPVSTGNHLMLFYNKKLVHEKLPKTTDEFIHLCKKIMKEHKGVYGFATNIDEPFFFIPWLASFGGWPMQGHAATLNTPAMHDALSFFKTLRDDEKIMPNECDYNCMDGLFKEGRAAFIINGDWAIDNYRKSLGNDFAITIMPINSKTNIPLRPMVSGKYLMMNSRLKDEALDWTLKFVRFYTNEENQFAQFEQLGRLPGTNKAYQKAKAKASDLLKASFDQLPIGLPAPMYVEMRAVWDAMRSQMGAYFGGRKTLDEAALFMQADADNKIEDMSVR